jgi:hypothetical protein
MEFSKSVIVFKDCILENNTNRTLRSPAKKNQKITLKTVFLMVILSLHTDVNSK